MKLNSDAACRDSSTSLGFLLGGFDGVVVAAKSMFLSYPLPPILAEIKGILEGMKFARTVNRNHIAVESDSLMAIRMIKDEIPTLGDELNWLLEVRSLASSFAGISFGHVHRLCNNPAHILAKRGVFLSYTVSWFSNFPSWWLDCVKA